MACKYLEMSNGLAARSQRGKLGYVRRVLIVHGVLLWEI